jgi:hypothetical protein
MSDSEGDGYELLLERRMALKSETNGWNNISSERVKYEIRGTVELRGCNIYFSAHRVALDGKSRKVKSLLQCFYSPRQRPL